MWNRIADKRPEQGQTVILKRNGIIVKLMPTYFYRREYLSEFHKEPELYEEWNWPVDKTNVFKTKYCDDNKLDTLVKDKDEWLDLKLLRTL